MWLLSLQSETSQINLGHLNQSEMSEIGLGHLRLRGPGNYSLKIWFFYLEATHGNFYLEAAHSNFYLEAAHGNFYLEAAHGLRPSNAGGDYRFSGAPNN